MNKSVTRPNHANDKGRWAEQLAQTWLQTQGLTPHTQNYTRRLGEIDLVLRDETQNAWVFVEVKYRSANAMVSGVNAITAAKQRKLYRTAELFLQRIHDQTSAARIDVIVITALEKATSDQHTKQKLNPRKETEYGHRYARLGDHELLWIQNAVLG